MNKDIILKDLERIFKAKDINKLTLKGYNELNLMSGFIAHYDINGFKAYYSDLRDLINSLKDSLDYDDFKELRDLINKYQDELYFYFKDLERTQARIEIISLIKKYNFTSEELKGF